MPEKDITREDVLRWLKHGSITPRKAEWVKEEPKEVELHKCPKSDKCIMDCYHKKPHEYIEKYCNDIDGECQIKCVTEFLSDCTFFEEDFNFIE